MRVAVCARRTERLKTLTVDLDATGETVLAIGCDLRSEADILAYRNDHNRESLDGLAGLAFPNDD